MSLLVPLVVCDRSRVDLTPTITGEIAIFCFRGVGVVPRVCMMYDGYPMLCYSFND